MKETLFRWRKTLARLIVKNIPLLIAIAIFSFAIMQLVPWSQSRRTDQIRNDSLHAYESVKVRVDSLTREAAALKKQGEDSIITAQRERNPDRSNALKAAGQDYGRQYDSLMALSQSIKTTAYAPDSSKAGIVRKNFSPNFFFVISIIILIIGAAGYDAFVSPKIFYTAQDSDPPELEELFKKYGDVIRGFDTPRKIKRFSNKTRLQYTLLKNYAAQEEWRFDTELFMILMLVIESDRDIVGSTLAGFYGKLQPKLRDFYNERAMNINADNEIEQNQQLIKKLFEMNQKILI